MSVDLRTCKKGDKLISKHGMVLTYVGILPTGSYMDHEVLYPKCSQFPKGASGSRSHDGFTYRQNRLETDHDIVEIVYI
jgi:hypothetical protein